MAVDVLDSLLEGCQVIGPDWRYQFLNTTAARQGGKSREELLGQTMMECYPGIETTPMFGVLRACMTERRHDAMENQFTFPDGSVGWFQLRFIPVQEGVCILSVDVTERRRAQAALERTEAQLRQAQKMDAIGRLAGGVAHDFNNLLSVILSYAEMATEGRAPDDPVREDLTQITAAGRRAAELTSQLLSLSRNEIADASEVDLNECAGGVAKMLERVLPQSVRLRLVTEPSLPAVFVNPGQIEQILMNLAVNSRDAMPNGGALTIETASVNLDEQYARDHFGTTAGPHVMLAVSDTGIGMDKETQLRIFEPFFTTKARGRGTGLGLSIVYGIVQQNRGSIWVYSEPGHGTTFEVYFPVASAETKDATTSVTAAPAIGARKSGATILLVEDEAQLRRLIAALLERAGHEVLAAATPDEALAIAKARGQDLDLLFTDLVLPGINGRELAQRVATDIPGLPTLFMSGFTDDPVQRPGVTAVKGRFVQKPFTPDRLIEAVREALGDARAR